MHVRVTVGSVALFLRKAAIRYLYHFSDASLALTSRSVSRSGIPKIPILDEVRFNIDPRATAEKTVLLKNKNESLSRRWARAYLLIG